MSSNDLILPRHRNLPRSRATQANTERARAISEYGVLTFGIHRRIRRARAWMAAMRAENDFEPRDRKLLIEEYISFCNAYGLNPTSPDRYQQVLKAIARQASPRMAEFRSRAAHHPEVVRMAEVA